MMTSKKQWTHRELKLDTKPGYTFKFTYSTWNYQKYVINLDNGGALKGPFSSRAPSN